MAHHHLKSGYQRLSERINKFPQGAPPSELLFKIFETLMKDSEAELMSRLPIRPFTAEKASKALGIVPSATKKILTDLASRALLLDMEQEDGTSLFMLPPPMAGFFEFTLMRVRNDIDQKKISELFYEYVTIEDDFMRELLTRGEMQLGRVFVNEPVLNPNNALHVLDYERASHVIKSAEHMAVGMCYCRHKKQHIGQACGAPMDICMTFGGVASSLIKYGHARRVDEKEGMKLLEQAYDHNLVQFGENVRDKVSFICNCCGCCCEALIAARKFGIMNPIYTTNFLPQIKDDTCTGCGKCVPRCPVEAFGLVSANDPLKSDRKIAKLNEKLCLGCGLCVKACPRGIIGLKSREKRIITPINSAHRAVVMAIERGLLQNLIFDNQAHLNHRAMAAILGVILKLPPLKQAMASRQMKSKYLDALLKRT